MSQRVFRKIRNPVINPTIPIRPSTVKPVLQNFARTNKMQNNAEGSEKALAIAAVQSCLPFRSGLISARAFRRRHRFLLTVGQGDTLEVRRTSFRSRWLDP